MPPGVLALGLVWNAQSEAAKALLCGAEIDHKGLLDLIQRELLGASLDGLLANFDACPSGLACQPEVHTQQAVARPTGLLTDASIALGPFQHRSAHPDLSDDETEKAPTASPTIPPSALARLPRSAGLLGNRFEDAEQLRERTSEDQPWVLATDDRVLKIYDFEHLTKQERGWRLAEARVGQSLGEVDGIVPILSVREVDGFLVTEMPRMGRSLQEHLECSERGVERRLAPELYAAALMRVALTLESMHDRGLVHGHIKPTNLLTDPATNWLSIAEFFVAHRRDTRSAAPEAGTRTWTRYAPALLVHGQDRYYVAPEQDLGDIGPSVDQYALGAVARSVFAARGAPPLTAPVHEVLQRATAPRAGDRFNSVGDFGRALLQAIRDEAPRGLADRVASLKPHRRTALIPALMAAAAAVILSSV